MLLSRAVDAALDRSLVGYTRVGIAVRRSLPGWPDDPVDLTGKRVAVTGATAGLGLAAAAGLVRRGADVVVIGRSAERVDRAVEETGAEAGEVCDVSDLTSVRDLVARWSGPLDVLVHNAGVMPPERSLTADGVELTFATNVLGPWLLTRDLSPLLAGGVVVNVSSGGMYGQRLDADLQSEDYRPVTAYARTKRAEVVLTEMWAERLAEQGTAVHAMHPGWARTPGIESSLPGFSKVIGPLLRTPEQGADTVVWLSGTHEPSGCFWHDRRTRPTYLLGRNRESAADRDRLWALCEQLAG